MAFRILHLANPPMHGDDVKAAQRLLHENKFGNYYHGTIDGVYGQESAAAARRAKYWLGYPKSDINSYYGAKLRDFLKGTVSLTTLMRARRKRRLAIAAATPMRVKALNKAKTQLGYRESGNNITKYGAWYGWNAAWCAMFVSWCYYMVGCTSVFHPGTHYAGVPNIYEDAKARRNHLSITTSPKPGDLVLYDWPATGSANDHVELFEKWVNSSEFYAIGGNTGDMVARRLRYRSSVHVFVHVGV